MIVNELTLKYTSTVCVLIITLENRGIINIAAFKNPLIFLH